MGKRVKPEEIIMKLREVEIYQGKGLDISAACRQARGTLILTFSNIAPCASLVFPLHTDAQSNTGIFLKALNAREGPRKPVQNHRLNQVDWTGGIYPSALLNLPWPYRV